ncbi:MAG: hypothetical protein ACI9HK_005047, partial [Pirellulaceae bacterium]
MKISSSAQKLRIYRSGQSCHRVVAAVAVASKSCQLLNLKWFTERNEVAEE